MSRVVPFLLLFSISISFVHAEFRTFTNDFGDSVEAKLIELKKEDSIIRMQLRNGRKIDAKLSAFSQSDQKYIRKWWGEVVAERQILHKQARIDVEIKIDTKTRSSGHSSWYSESDDKTKIFYPEVTIENNESQTFKGNELRLVIFADDMRYKGQMKVVSASSIKTDLKEREEIVLEPDAFRLRHYEYDSNYFNYDYEYGYKYSGYAMTLKNSKGEVIYEDATKDKFLKSKHLYSCKKGQIFDEDFKRRLKSSGSSSSYAN
ncbi:hypothetical protein DDZ13_01205 [Coraliomargarita sinensis]|uniref:SLA1 homology domain-containing protein n=1 Tax=Coraliomargarita sinensis TaxID=2174842 RepID=A0A317ZNR4_9BACT|nr:hypothetical protein [Coraliomargarita sinensis]PXA05518.1 hypothetical protein DDZ13_01205 [Coraliomargarita sinensis]